MMRALIVGLSWLFAPAARRLEQALADPQAAQAALEARIAQAAARTRFGQARGLTPDTLSLNKLAPSTWHDVKPYADLEKGGEARALTPDPVVVWESTSGSGGEHKAIPYTRSMLNIFRRMFSAWAYNVITEGPRLSRGRFYFSISPSWGSDEQGGLQTDADYLASWQRRLMGPWFVLPDIEANQSADAFKDATCLSLLAAPDLEIISVWSPTFLSVMLDHLSDHWDRLRTRVSHTDARRAATLQSYRDMPHPQQLWPHLKFISCWKDAFAEGPAAVLQKQFDRVCIQGKGLLATEGPVTIPLIRLDHEGLGQVPLVNDTLIELEDDHNEIVPLSSAEQGRVYRILISTPAGLLRYRLGDLVEVRGTYRRTPLLKLVGRADAVCDLVGEKLAEAHVVEVLKGLHPDHFSVLMPAESKTHYLLLTDDAKHGLADRLDRALSENFHYRQARALGQLKPPAIVIDPHPSHRLLQAWLESGRNPGDLKPGAFVRVALPLKE